MPAFENEANLRLDRIIDFAQNGRNGSFRTHLDEWAAFHFGGLLLTRGGKQKWLNNPCPWTHSERLFAHADWITPDAANILRRGAAREVAVKKPKSGQPAPHRLIVDHSVPVRVLRDLVIADESLWERSKLSGFLLEYFKRGVLTAAEDARLNTPVPGEKKSLKQRMPTGWQRGRDPFARYHQIGLTHYQNPAAD